MNPAEYDILILDDGELAEIRAAAHTLGATVYGDMDAPGTPLHWSLVVSSARYLDELEAIPVDLSAKRVVVVDQLSQTFRARIRRARVDFFLCRPVHPEALRLLLLHCLYRGPERRRRRVAIGTPIRFRSGFRKSDGVLADLSGEGCRILTRDPLRKKQKLLVFLPRAHEPARTFYVRAEVVRAVASRQAPHQIALSFQNLNSSARQRVADLMALHQQGPATFRGLPGNRAEGERPTTPIDPATSAHAATGKRRFSNLAANPSAFERVQEGPPDRQGSPASPEHPPVEAGALDADVETQPVLNSIVSPEPSAAGTERQPVVDERRHEPRREFSRHVVALDRSATRVLIGRDLSVGGMRVDPHPALMLRKSFRLSIHVVEGELPLVVRARVARDDGERGIALRFEQLGFAVQEHLRKSLRELPISEQREGAEPQAVLVTEILDDALEDLASAG